MAAIFSRLASMPRSKMTNLRSLPEGTLKTHFSRLSLMRNFRRLAKVFLQVFNEASRLPGLDDDVVDVDFKVPT